MTAKTCKIILPQVPPDFLIPESDEDEPDPDERVDRKYLFAILVPVIFCIILVGVSFMQTSCVFPEHTEDKHIQRDDEYYDGDNDNDHNMDDAP
jgi:histone deacetylase 1/2